MKILVDAFGLLLFLLSQSFVGVEKGLFKSFWNFLLYPNCLKKKTIRLGLRLNVVFLVLVEGTVN